MSAEEIKSIFSKGLVQNIILESKQRAWPIERLHCDSYDRFVELVLEIVRENSVIAPTWNKHPRRRCVIEYLNPRLGVPILISQDGQAKPCLPHECRDRQAFYSAALRADITLQMYKIETVEPGDPDYKSPEEREKETSTPEDEAGPGPTPYKRTTQSRYIKVGGQQTLRGALLGMIPVCVGSKRHCNLHLLQTRKGECPYDQGGYLIVRGFEKCVQPQKNLLPGKAIITAEGSRTQRSVLYEAEVRSPHKFRARNTAKTTMSITGTPCNLFVQIPFLGHGKRMVPVPLVVLFKLLGFSKREEIRSLVFPMFDPNEKGTDCTVEGCLEFVDHEPTARAMQQARATFETMFLHPRFSHSFPALYEWLASESDNSKDDRRRAVHNQIKAECLPQFGSDFTLAICTKKGLFLGSIAQRLLLMRANPELFPPDYKDDDGNKYLQLMHSVFSIMVRQLIVEINNRTKRRLYRLLARAEPTINLSTETQRVHLTRDIEKRLGRGDVTVQKVKGTTSGSVQILTNTNQLGMRAHLSRIGTPMAREGKYTETRILKPMSMGVLCPTTTPEGKDVGLVESLSLGVHVRFMTPTSVLVETLRRFKNSNSFPLVVMDMFEGEQEGKTVLELTDRLRDARSMPVYCNHDIVGVTYDAPALCETARAARRSGTLPIDCSVTWEQDGVHVDADDGVMMFPCFRLKSLHLLKSALELALRSGEEAYDTLLRNGVLEILSTREATRHARIAVTWRDLYDSVAKGHPIGSPGAYTHMIPHP